jgi:hypothetical protein
MSTVHSKEVKTHPLIRETADKTTDPTSGTANARKVTLAKTPIARILPRAPTSMLVSFPLALTILPTRYSATAYSIVSSEFEKGRTRKLKVMGAVAKSRRGISELVLRDIVQSDSTG